MQIRGIHSHNFINAGEQLITVYGKYPVVRKNSQWIVGPGITLTSDLDAYMTSMIDKTFLVNGTDANASYDGTVWSQTADVDGSPIAKYITDHTSRVILFNVKILGEEYASRAWISDLPNNGTLTWGLQTGTDLAQTSGSAEVTSASSNFVTRNIKVGDPLYITTGLNARSQPYTVQGLGDTDGDDRQTKITLTEELSNTDTGSSFWVGGNWFDVKSDDGDVGTGLGYTSNEVFFFKKGSVHRYNVSGNELRRINSVPGTTSPRSIVSWNDFVYWYHPTGIYRSNGPTGQRISPPIEDLIEGISTSNRSLVVGWVNEQYEEINFYVGDVTDRDGETITNCVLTFDTNSEIWSFKNYGKIIKCATGWLKDSTPEVYIGDDNAGVFKLESSTSFNGSDIPFAVTIEDIFPEGSETLLTFDRLRSYVSNGQDIQLYYRLKYKPMETTSWIIEKDWTPMRGSQRGEKTEWYFQEGARASGFDIKVIESGQSESFLLEKFVVYYSNPSNW